MQYYDLNSVSNFDVLKNIFKSLSGDNIKYILDYAYIKNIKK